MKPRHVAVATFIAVIWGLNFVIIRIGLDNLPPLLFAALRFAVAAFPIVLFVGRPPVPWRWLLLIGLPLGVGQFGLLFIGMHMGMPAGLSSVVLQAQALFTVLFAGVLLHERLRARQAVGMAIAFAGITLIGLDFGKTSPVLAFALCVVSAAMWGIANVGLRRVTQITAKPPDAFAFMVWVSVVPPLPLLALSLIFEGPRADLHALAGISLSGLGALAYIAYISTLVGYGLWGWLMRRYDAGVVAMYTLLVPPVGLAAGAVFLGEKLGGVLIVATALVICGVALGSVRLRTAPAGAGRAEPRPAAVRSTLAERQSA